MQKSNTKFIIITAKTGDDLSESVSGGDNVWDVTPNPDLYQMIYNASLDHFSW